jgi:hypothetical protein
MFMGSPVIPDHSAGDYGPFHLSFRVIMQMSHWLQGLSHMLPVEMAKRNIYYLGDELPKQLCRLSDTFQKLNVATF